MSQTGKKLISVIIATFKRPQSLRATLESILICAVDKSFDYELIVVDNNSLDDTENVVREMMPKFTGRLKYIFEAKQGRSFALNTALQLTNGDYVALTDDDCLVDKEWFVRIVEVFSHKDIDILTGKIIAQIDRPIPPWVDLEHKAFWGPIGRYDLGNEYIDSTRRMIYAPGANLVLRRTSIDKFGLFTKSFRGQDTELCYRWQKLGAKVGYSPQIVISHRTQSYILDKKYLRQWYFYSGKNSAFIFSENYSFTKPRITRTPLWVYKKLFQKIWCYLKNLTRSKNMFIYELWIWFSFGEISGVRELKRELDKKKSVEKQKEKAYVSTR